MCKSNFFWYVGALLLVVLSMVVGSYFQLLKDVPNRNGGVEWGLIQFT